MMKNIYKVVSELPIQNKLVVTLDKDRTDNEYGTTKIKVGENIFDYELTHAENTIVVNTETSILGNQISFQ